MIIYTMRKNDLLVEYNWWNKLGSVKKKERKKCNVSTLPFFQFAVIGCGKKDNCV